MKNMYEVIGDITYIYAESKGVTYTIVIDTKDLELVSKYTWGIIHKTTKYARAEYRENGRRIKLYMHRLILNPREDMLVDHWDRNGLNNTRDNLREATHLENMINSSNVDRATYITFDKGKDRYRVRSKRKHVGWYKTMDEAIKARDLALIEGIL